MRCNNWLQHLQVCTAKGCTLSNEVSGRTLEGAPQGTLTLEVIASQPREVVARWNRLQNTNGVVMYTVYFDGLYYADSG